MNQKITELSRDFFFFFLLFRSATRPKFRLISETLNVCLKQQLLLIHSHFTGPGRNSGLSVLSGFFLSFCHLPPSSQSSEVWTGGVNDKLGRKLARLSGSEAQSPTKWLVNREVPLIPNDLGNGTDCILSKPWLISNMGKHSTC